MDQSIWQLFVEKVPLKSVPLFAWIPALAAGILVITFFGELGFHLKYLLNREPEEFVVTRSYLADTVVFGFAFIIVFLLTVLPPGVSKPRTVVPYLVVSTVLWGAFIIFGGIIAAAIGFRDSQNPWQGIFEWVFGWPQVLTSLFIPLISLPLGVLACFWVARRMTFALVRTTPE